MARKKKPRPIVEEYLDLVAWVTRTSLSYGVNSAIGEGIYSSSEGRTHYLYGVVALPHELNGLQFEAMLLGKKAQENCSMEGPELSVAFLQKTGEWVSVTTSVPPDFVATLFAAYSDGRLNLFHGHGPKIRRNKSLLTSIHFQDRAYFEDHWGEPIPDLPRGAG